MVKSIYRYFDFLYYCIYTFYAPKEKGAAFSAASIVAGLLTVNVLTIWTGILVYHKRRDLLNAAAIIAAYIVFEIILYIRYIYRKNNSVLVIEKKWTALEEDEKVRYRILNTLYIGLTFLVFFVIVIFGKRC